MNGRSRPQCTAGRLRRRGALAGLIAVAGLLLSGCAAGATPSATASHTPPPRPEALASEQVRAVDGCALISAYVLQRVFFHDGPGDLHLGIAADVGGCDVFMADAGAGPAEPVYRISLAAWPTAKQWPEVTGGARTSKEGGGWLVVGTDSDAQEMYGYIPRSLGDGSAPRGVGYKVVALKPSAGDLDVRRETAIMSMILVEASHGALPTIPWSHGNLLTRDICAAAKTAGLAQALGLTDPEPRPLVVMSPDARSCAEKATGGDSPRFQVSAGLVNALDTGTGAESATIGGHQASLMQEGSICRVTIAYPGDSAVVSRVADGGARTTALTVTAGRPCAQVVAAAEPFVALLDRTV